MKAEFVDGIVALKLPDPSGPGILPFPVQPVLRVFFYIRLTSDALGA